MTKLMRKLRQQKGASMVEYAVLVAIVVGSAAGLLGLLLGDGGALETKFESIATEITTGTGTGS